MPDKSIGMKKKKKSSLMRIRRRSGSGGAAEQFFGKRHFYDYNLLAAVLILICFGLIMLYSASAYEAAVDAGIGNDMYYFRRQALISAGVVALAFFASRINYHFLEKLALPFYVLALFFMSLVKFSPLGNAAGGARRWLQLGPISFQPSELAKLAIIILVPALITRMGKNIRTAKGLALLLGIGFIQAFGAYWLTDNLSTAIIIMGICVFMIFIAHPRTLPFIGLGLLGTGAGFVAIQIIRATVTQSNSFRMRRILAWLHPETNREFGGYQVLQGLYAIGNGGIFGKGLGNSTQKLSWIPEAQNDMIFSIICEELGLFGAVVLLSLFAYLLYRLLFIAYNAPDLYGSLIVCGVFAHMAIQVILNVCVVLNVIPTTGVTLPFVSYGGTSVIFLMAEIALALSVSSRIEFRDMEAGEKTGEGGGFKAFRRRAKGIDKKK